MTEHKSNQQYYSYQTEAYRIVRFASLPGAFCLRCKSTMSQLADLQLADFAESKPAMSREASQDSVPEAPASFVSLL